MSVPGVNVIVAASFLAAIGDIHRFQSARKPPATSASIPGCVGPGPATDGHISKQGLGQGAPRGR